MPKKQDIIDAWRSLTSWQDRIDVAQQLSSICESQYIEEELSPGVSDDILLNNDTKHVIVVGDILQSGCLVNSPVDMVFTSPPYNAKIQYDEYNDEKTTEDYLSFLQDAFDQVDKCVKPGGRVIINIRDITMSTGSRFPIIVHFYNHLCIKLGYKYRGLHIWYKGREESSTGWGSFMKSSNPSIIDLYEYVFVFQKSGSRKNGDDDMTKSEFIENVLGIWKIRPVKKIFSSKDGPIQKVAHPCPFPVELAKRVIRVYSNVGDTVFDPVAGIATTSIAAAMCGRNSICFDISPSYVQLGKKYFRCKVGNLFSNSKLVSSLEQKL